MPMLPFENNRIPHCQRHFYKMQTSDIIPPRGYTFSQEGGGNSLPGTSKVIGQNNTGKLLGRSGGQAYVLLREQCVGALIPSLPDPIPLPSYTSEGKNWAIQRVYILIPQGCYELDQKLHLPQSFQ